MKRKKDVDSTPINIVNNLINNNVLTYSIANCKPFYRPGYFTIQSHARRQEAIPG